MKSAMPDSTGAFKVSYEVAVYIGGGIAAAFFGFVRWYMVGVKEDIKKLNTSVEKLDKETREDVGHAHKRIDNILKP